MKLIKRKSAGFTLIELIVAFTIISILSVISFAAYVSFSRNQAVGNEANQLVSVLNLAKSKVQSQVKPSSCTTSLDPLVNRTLTEYRVVIEQANNQYKLVAVCGGSLINIPIEGSSSIYHKIPSPITVDANYTISFNVLSGVVSPTPTTITLNGGWVPSIVKTVTINSDGTIQ